MRSSLPAALCAAFLVVACGDGERDPAAVRAELAETKAEQAENARIYREEQKRKQTKLAAIQYPACDTVWSNGKATPCGRKVFEVAMAECVKLAREEVPAMARGSQLDEYAGDSWIDAGGRDAIQSVDQRVAYMEKGRQSPDGYQDVAFILWNGTDAVQRFTCQIDDLKLSDGWAGSVKSTFGSF